MLNLDTLILDKGAHDRPEDGMCLLEAVAFMAGEPFTDHPVCASPVVSAFLRTWNDQLPDAERQQLKQYIPRLIGSVGSPELEAKRAWMAADWLVRVQTPAWLRLAGLTDQATLLEGMAEVTSESVPSIKAPLEAVRMDARAARDAAGAAARAAAWAAARAAAWDAAWAAAWAAAWDAARAAAGDAAWDAARAAAGDAAGDAAWAAAGAAARAALRPTTQTLQASAHVLVGRMLDATL